MELNDKAPQSDVEIIDGALACIDAESETNPLPMIIDLFGFCYSTLPLLRSDRGFDVVKPLLKIAG